jgi:hypothetical protein
MPLQYTKKLMMLLCSTGSRISHETYTKVFLLTLPFINFILKLLHIFIQIFAIYLSTFR